MIPTLTELHAEHDGIEARLLALGEEAADIKRQLGNAKATGNYDRRWFAAAESALRFKNVERQRLQSELGKVNEKIREADKAGLVAVDADRHDPNKDGVEALKRLETEHDVLPDRPITTTASNGEHHIFKQPAGEPLTNSRGALPEGFFDVRGVGGYIVAPGSITGADGDWRTDADAPELIESFKAGTIPTLPDWLAGIIRAPKVRTEPEAAPNGPEPRTDASHEVGARERAYAQKALDENCAELAGLREGGRNNALNGIGYRMGRMIAAGRIDRGTVESELWRACQANALLRDDGRRQVMATIKSGIEAGMKGPPLADLAERARQTETPIPDYGFEFGDDGSMHDKETGELVTELPPGFKLAHDAVPEARDLIKGILPSEGVFFIGGQTQAGKTYIAVHMAYCLSSGTEFFGRRIKERVGSVFLVAEGAASFHRRMRLAHQKMECGGTEQPIAYFGNPQPYLSSDKGVDALIPQLKGVSKFFQDGLGIRLGAIFYRHRCRWLCARK
jgi:hypothetical protein